MEEKNETQPVALVTGASRGVGFRVARMLHEAGFAVYGHYRSSHPDLDISWWQADFTAPVVAPQLPRIDALIHCAGVAKLGSAASASREDWEEHMAVNLHAPVELTAQLLPRLRHSRGQVVYINSGAGKRANPNWGAYASSKFAARAWCEALRAEEPDIRVSSVFPGRIDTDMQRAIVAQEGGTYHPESYLDPELVAQTVVDLLATPVTVDLQEIVLRPRQQG